MRVIVFFFDVSRATDATARRTLEDLDDSRSPLSEYSSCRSIRRARNCRRPMRFRKATAGNETLLHC